MAERETLIDFPSTPDLFVLRAGTTYFEVELAPIELEDAPVEALKFKLKSKDWTELGSAVLRTFEIVSVGGLQLTVEEPLVTIGYPRDSALDVTVFEPKKLTLKVTGLSPGTTYDLEVEAANFLGSSPSLALPITTLNKVYRKLYVWGNNSDGDLGFQNEGISALTMINQPIRHPEIDSPLSFIAGGRQRSAAISADGEIIEWGRVVTEPEEAKTEDQLIEIISSPVYLQLSTPMAFSKVALGASFGIALSVTGTIYSWGLGEYKELAQGDKLFLPGPEPIQAVDLRFKDIAAGMNSCVACTTNGELYEWGLVVQPFNSQLIAIAAPIKLNVYEQVESVRAGGNSRVSLMDDGSVYTWGYNLSGELGHGTKDTIPLPRKLEGLSHIVDVACGFDHMLFLESTGSVWASGLGKKGELGVGDCRSHLTPIKIPKLGNVKGVAAGLKFSLFLLDTGEVYSCGEGKNACLGIGVPGKASTPRKVKFTAHMIGAGLGHSMGLVE
mmetsp:Transcript_32042/g.55251  ORF Transcript_32042/g.55251 Transcript_32042/m.55251 type:complete len:499 (-) Transcript_32042:1993-3489(-)